MIFLGPAKELNIEQTTTLKSGEKGVPGEFEVLDVSSQNSVRDCVKVIGKKWIYLARNKLHRQILTHLKR